MAGNIFEGCQGTEGDLHVRVFFDNLYARIEMLTVDHELLATP